MSQPKTAVLLVNLGSPDEPTPAAVRRYLKEFLSDRRVVEGNGIMRLVWLTVLNGIILTFRPRKVAKLYASIWDQDSPLRLILNQQVAALQLALQQQMPAQNIQVYSAMTYGNPGLTARLEELTEAGYKKILVVPLYPQYSATTTAPIYDLIARFQMKTRDFPDIRVIHDYHDHPLYIRALAESVQTFQASHPHSDKLILSYHGIPQEYAAKGDPYPEHCHRTSELLAKALGLVADQWQTTFQSRFGPKAWLQPYTDKTLEALPERGVKKVDIICPAFAADCLETLEEIAVENRDVFTEAGGEQYQYIPALNAEQGMINLLVALVQENSTGWFNQADTVNEQKETNNAS
ncbi:ferrochelatase [Amphritea sp. 2_MG-2023]|uniref:ferrochelatase n=1 Tax=Amphritea TaxID=515417 RepID=UPI001C07807D|nr:MULTISPECIES: ferrochelatase [Amphritea]MBU2967526.1 ferrochelatase [Amphritea atlantica]MDO6420532.1 ferrochelatase [Amphritea sp. 2_MG-2023]